MMTMDSEERLTMWAPVFADFNLFSQGMAAFGMFSAEKEAAEQERESRLELGIVPTNDSSEASTLNNLDSKPNIDSELGSHDRLSDFNTTCSIEEGDILQSSQCSLSNDNQHRQHFDIHDIKLHGSDKTHSGKTSFSSSMTTLADQPGVIPMTVVDSLPLPAKKYSRFYRNLRWTFLSVYRRLSFLVIIPNIIVMIVLGAQRSLVTLTPDTLATAVSANLLASIIIRQELVINLLFIIFGRLPHCFPLRIRRLSAKIYHLGGVHSGAGIAALLWFGLFNVSIFNMNARVAFGVIKVALLTLTIALDLLLLSIVILAHPALRTKWHNTFEMVHRFAGWSTVGVFWALFVILAEAQRRSLPHPTQLWKVFVRSPVFWMLVSVTISIVLPWLKLRRVPVVAEPLSDHAIRLHFRYTNVPISSAPRMTDRPLKEWHAFAGIAEEDGNGYSVLISNAGDWTANIIRNPPTHLWVRGIPTRGVLNVAPIFKKLILVATGSGIGPIMSVMHAKNLQARVLWSTPEPEKTFTKGIIQQVERFDPHAVIINTTTNGRPNLVARAWEMYKDFDAEAVFIISNARVTRKFVYGLEARGVPTFAPIFDS